MGSTLTNVLKQIELQNLIRAIKTDKEYLFFDISVFNAGYSCFIKCSNIYKQINQNLWNGHDFWMENDSTTRFYIAQELKNRLFDGSIEDKKIKQVTRLIKAYDN